MNRRRFLFQLTATSATLVTGAAFAASYADAVIAQLTRQGFYNIGVETTWLGRVRIVADRGDGKREIILNPRTGEILRDSWQASGAAGATPIIDDVSGGAPAADGTGDGVSSSGRGADGSGGTDHSGSGGGTDDQGDGSGHDGSDDSGHGESGNSGGNGDGGASGDNGHGGSGDSGNGDNGGKDD